MDDPIAAGLIVLGSSRRDRAGAYRISPACRRVVAHATRLAERDRTRLVLFSGWAPDGGVSEAVQMRALWRRQDGEVVLEETASTTAENASRTLPLVRDRGVDRVTVVSTPLHLYRARWFFRRLYSAAGIETAFEVPRILPTPSSLVWELGALAFRSRQLRAAEEELRRQAESHE